MKKTQNTFTSSIPNPLPPPAERGWGMRSAHNNSSLPLLPPHTFPLLQRGVLHGVLQGNLDHLLLLSPWGSQGSFSHFSSPSWLWAQPCPVLGRLDPAVSSKGQLWLLPSEATQQTLGTCTPTDPQTGFINRALKAEIPLGKLGNTVGCHLSPGRRAPSQFLCQSLCTRQVL